MNNSITLTSNNENYNSTISSAFNRINGSSALLSNGSFPTNAGSSVTNNDNETTYLQQQLIFYGYILLFLFGYFGHISTIIIFLRRTLRSVSTSCLFICVTIANIVYVSVCIYDFLYVGIGLSPVNFQTNPTLSNAICRFRSFIQSIAMCSSAWLLVAISVDRWLRIRYPFKVKQLCTIKRVLFGALIILICAILLNSHLLLPSLGSLTTTICGPISDTTYKFFYREVWSILLTCLQIVLPTIILLFMTMDMFHRLRAQQKRKQRLNRNRRRSFVERQMLIIMLTSIFLFFSTQIPLSLFNILLSPVLRNLITITQALELTSIFNYVASINYASTFYVHCLTSGLFRQEFHNVLCCCLRCRNRRVGIVPSVRTAQAMRDQTFALAERRVQQVSSIT